MSLKFGGSTINSAAKPKIVVFGVGGGGCNAINHMMLLDIKGVDFVIANTDAQALESSPCENKIQLGSTITGGLGAGSVPEIGKRSAEESLSEIEDYIRDAHMVFVAAGMGGGTGTGAAPVIAKIAKEKGILTIGVVTKPFAFEREKRTQTAEAGIAEMRKYCDTTITIANQNLFRLANAETTLTEAFKMADNVLVSGIRCITDLITNSGLVNLDFADVSVIMSDMGHAVMGEGEGTGEDRAIRAAENAMTNPLLEESSIKGMTGLLINITGGNDITLFEINDIIDRITSEVDQNANIKFGSIIKEENAGTIRVSIVATGVAVSKDYHTETQKETDTAKQAEYQQETQESFEHEPHESFFAYEEQDNTELNEESYTVPQQEELPQERDYFSSFYQKHLLSNQEETKTFVPKQTNDISNISKDIKKENKFDIKSLFKINRDT